MSFGFIYSTNGEIKYSYAKNVSSVKNKHPDMKIVSVFDVPEKYNLVPVYKKCLGESKVYEFCKANLIHPKPSKSTNANKKGNLKDLKKIKIRIQDPIEESYYSESEYDQSENGQSEEED